MISVPGLRWTDVGENMPRLARIADRAGVGSLSVRAPKLTVDLAGSYATLGAGDKAVGTARTAPGADGAAFAVDEPVGTEPAGVVHRRLAGRAPAGRLVHLGVAPLQAANTATTFAAGIGRLGDALAAAGWTTAVIANADAPASRVSGGPGPPRRPAATALMTSSGTVGGGRVDTGLLRADPDAPFGVRLHAPTVIRTVAETFRQRSVVLVEASDVIRADLERDATAPDRYAARRAAALRGTDRLLHRLVGRTDPTRDAVLVVAPTPASGPPGLGVAVLAAPGRPPGLLRSGTTQRAGFVQMMDVGPTILHLAGIDRPTSMRGRPISVVADGRTGPARRAALADVDAATRFRAPLVSPVAWAFIVVQLVLAAVVAVTVTRPAAPGLGRRAAGATPILASAALAVIPAVYLARLVPFHRFAQGRLWYWAFLVAAVAVLTAVAGALARGRPVDRLLFGLGTVTAVLLVDGLTGSHLQFNSALGFSPEAAGRFIGYGNAGFAALTGGSLILAGLLTHRVPRTGTAIAAGVLLAVLAVDASPLWGADVGGALSTAPAYGAAVVLLSGRRLRPRTVAALTGATLALIAVAMLIDLHRPPGDRTHLGRLVEQVGGEGMGELVRVVQRKLAMNLQSLATSSWRVLPPIALAVVALLALHPDRPLARVLRRVPALRPTLVAFAVLLVLAWALNDTGVQVPAIMLGMLLPVLAALHAPGEEASAAVTRGGGP